MDSPHVVVVEEAVASLFNEFDLMGNLMERYADIDKVDGPVMFREQINEQLDDTVKLDFPFDIEIPGDDVQEIQQNVGSNEEADVWNACTPVEQPNSTTDKVDGPRENINEQVLDDTVPFDFSFEIVIPHDEVQDIRNDQCIGSIDMFDTPTLIAQPNGDLMMGKRVDDELNDTDRSNARLVALQNTESDNQDESAIDKEFAEFDPMDYICINPTNSTEKLKDLMVEEKDNEKFDEPMNVDQSPIELETADENNIFQQEIIIPKDHSEHLLNEVSNHADPLILNKENIEDEEMRLVLSPSSNELQITSDNDHSINLVMNNIASPGSACSSSISQKYINHEFQSEMEHDVIPISEIKREKVDECNGFENNICINYKPMVRLTRIQYEKVRAVPTTPTLNEDEENFTQSDSKAKSPNVINISGLNDNEELDEDEEATDKKLKSNKKIPHVLTIKDRTYNIRKRKAKKIATSPDLGSDISSASSSSDEESNSWSGTTASDTNDEVYSSSNSVYEEPIQTKYNLRNR